MRVLRGFKAQWRNGCPLAGLPEHIPVTFPVLCNPIHQIQCEGSSSGNSQWGHCHERPKMQLDQGMEVPGLLRGWWTGGDLDWELMGLMDAGEALEGCRV